MSDFREELIEVMAQAIRNGMTVGAVDHWRASAALDAALAYRQTVGCGECGGTGRIILDTRDLGGDPCPTCNGDGRVPGETRLAIVEPLPENFTSMTDLFLYCSRHSVFVSASDLPEGTPEP